MRSASVSDLHTKTSELVRNAADGEVIVIERHGKPVAELRPAAVKRTSKRPKNFSLADDMAHIWNTFPQVSGDSGRFLEEYR